MKDLRFTGGALTNPVIYRVDSISGQGNVTVMEIYGLDDRRPEVIDTKVERDLISTFKKINYTVEDFKAFAAANSLNLEISDTDGSNNKSLTLTLTVTVPAQGATGVSATPTFSGTASPGALITIVISGVANQTATANASGAWSKVSSSLGAAGAKVAVITASKDGASTSVTRNFTSVV